MAVSIAGAAGRVLLELVLGERIRLEAQPLWRSIPGFYVLGLALASLVMEITTPCSREHEAVRPET